MQPWLEVGDQCGTTLWLWQGMLSPIGAVTDIAPQLLTHTAPAPCALAALYLPARLPQAATEGQTCPSPTSWQWGWSVDEDWSMSPQQDGIPVPNPAKRLFSLTRLSRSPALALPPVSVQMLLFDFLHKKIRADHSQESFPSSWYSPRPAPPLTQKSLIQYSPLRTADFRPLSACSERGVLCCLLGASSAAGSCFHSMQWPALSWTVTLLCYFYISSGLSCAITWIIFSFFFFFW